MHFHAVPAARYGFLTTPLPLLPVVLFMIGIETRVQIEDALLAAIFGESFKEYKRRVPAYIPLLK